MCTRFYHSYGQKVKPLTNADRKFSTRYKTWCNISAAIDTQ